MAIAGHPTQVGERVVSKAEERRVIIASSVGTVFEWYDFYLYAILAAFFAALFFPPGNQTAALLGAFGAYAAGFLVRPFGALIFGRVGDLVGRKYTFLVTIVFRRPAEPTAVLALAGVNAAAMAVFSAIYGAGALRTLSQPAFMAALLLTFVGAVALWVRVEGHRARRNDAVARLGRATGGFAIALLGLPTLVLAPMFALGSQLPAEVGLDHVTSRVMVLLLIGLGLTAGVNAVGALVAAGAALAGRRVR